VIQAMNFKTRTLAALRAARAGAPAKSAVVGLDGFVDTIVTPVAQRTGQGDAFTPILNLPQAAILGIGRIVQEPVVREGRVEVGETLSLSLTFDHRVTDGAPAARWLQSLSQRIASLQD